MSPLGEQQYIIHAPGESNSHVTIDKFVFKEIPRSSRNIYRYNPIGFKRLTLNRESSRWPQNPFL